MSKSLRQHFATLIALVVALATALPAVAQEAEQAPEGALALDKIEDRRLRAAVGGISPTRLESHAKFLASDLLEGRGTGERGGEIATEYIATQYELTGLGKAIPTGDGTTTYFQKVPLVGVETDLANSIVALANDEETFTPTFLEQGIFWTETQQEMVETSGELVFVGYGIYAPEVNWDDYKDVDVTGKVLLMLVNDPPSADPNQFGGPALTYYGRWTYKYWIAAAKGAAGAILVHNTDMAGYGWDVVRSSWGDEQSFRPLDPEGTPPLQVAGWLTEETAGRLATMGGQDLAALKQAAAHPDFQPVSLGLDVAARIISKTRQFETRNIVGFIAGGDPTKQLEFLIYTAHYDHLGLGQEVDGDNIYNGMQDNASGVAAMLEIARAFSRRGIRPGRTLLFLATSAEEQGLLGSKHFTDRRNLFIFPGRMAANINLDGLTALGQSRDFVLLGAERSPDLTRAAEEAATLLEFTISPDPHPEKGSYFRSDHFNFAQLGVPTLWVRNGLDYVGQPAGWGEEQYQDYLANRYHRPSDEHDASLDFTGLAKTAQIAFYLGHLIGNADTLPMWNPGDQYEEPRKESLTEVEEAAAAQQAGQGETQQ
jgi:Zn-dependent M28 family amino/carboxypeptidase